MFKVQNLFLILCMMCLPGMAQVLKDPRDNQEYKTVKIGEQIWVAENLSFAAEESYCYTRFGYDGWPQGRFRLSLRKRLRAVCSLCEKCRISSARSLRHLNRSSAPLLGVGFFMLDGFVEVGERFAVFFDGKLRCVKAV